MNGIDFSSPLVIGLLTGMAVAIIGAFFTGFASLITAWRTVATKVSAMEAHVNSEKTAADGRENTLKAENVLLRELIGEKKQAAALLAQTAAVARRANDPATGGG